MPVVVTEDRLRRRDYLIIAAVCLLFFGHALVIGRVLSMHEGILPQTAREMYADHDWMVPKNGGRPWLEKPPLPQWITVAVASVFGRCDAPWIVRIPPILMGTSVVLMVAWMASLWFGRTVGYLSGLILATCWQFVRYSTYAEADIFLCAIVTAAIAVFVRIEFVERARGAGEGRHFLGRRSWLTVLFFVLLGLTNLAKGFLFGTAMALVPIAGFLLWNADHRRLLHYVWLWGGLFALAIAAVWPICAYLRHPDVLALWRADSMGRLNGGYIGEPWYYYAVTLPWLFLPWTPIIPVGFWQTAPKAIRERFSAQRFLWCWAVLPPLVFSFPDGKHHHYLLQGMAPWAVLGALGTLKLWQWAGAWPSWLRQPLLGSVCWSVPGIGLLLLFGERIPGPDWFRPALLVTCPLSAFALCWAALQRNGRLALATFFSVLLVLYVAVLTYKAHHLDRCRADTEFLAAIEPLPEPGTPVYVSVERDCMESFRLLFYLGDRAKVLHNLTFIQDDQIGEEELLLVVRQRFEADIANYGAAEKLLQSERTRREATPEDRWTLYRVRLRDDLKRQSAHVPLSQRQIADRERGPYLGGKPPRHEPSESARRE